MSRITKQIAENVTEKLVNKKRNELIQINDKISELATQIVLKNTPKEVLNLFKTRKNYFQSTSSVRFDNNDFKWEWFTLYETLPSDNNHYPISDEESKKMFDLINKRDKAKSDLRKLKSEIYQALINLKTFKRVESDFPEAFEFLPKNGSTALVVNVESIRKQLK